MRQKLSWVAICVGAGFLGMALAVSALHAYQDHQALHAIIAIIDNAQKAQAPK
jgi:hypothetical protein